MSWQAEALVELVRVRYPEWDGFSHAPFVADEIRPKRKLRERWLKELDQTSYADLLAQNSADEIIRRLIKVGRSSSLLFSSIPKQGDLKLLSHPELNKLTYCKQLFSLLYDDAPLDVRMEKYSMELAQHMLPNQWSWATFGLFLTQPETAMFMKPRAARWFLQFMGDTYESRPNGATYERINALALGIKDELAAFGPQDLIDIQSIIWIAHRESRDRTGNLNPRAQVELDQPPSEFENSAEMTVADETAAYTVNQSSNKEMQYSVKEVAAAIALPEARVAQWVRALNRKGQMVLTGPPGTGKTFLAQQLARHLVACGDGFTEIVQFHASYAYEDFVQGLRPVERNGQMAFEQVEGHFVRFCERARLCDDLCVLIVDEINRANVSQVFGELMVGLEYRGQSVALAGGGRLTVPENVRLIGTMNTADRSIALVDFALRRRFAFVDIRPNYDLLRQVHKDLNFPVEAFVKVLQRLNAQIEPAYQIGVTYFLAPNLPEEISLIWEMEIEPYLAEYFFDQPDQIAAYRWQTVEQHL